MLGSRFLVVTCGLLALSAAGAPGLRAEPIPAALARKFDARLLSASLVSPGDTVSAWITFADKGERGGADLALRLAGAERALSPRNRARRIRAGLHPLVDALDLPVCADYVGQLAAAGFRPYAVSRWFNRAAVRLPAGDLGRAARFGFVSRLEPVEKAFVLRDPTGPEAAAPAAGHTGLADALARIGQATSVDYGNSLDEMQQLNMVAVHDSGYIGQGVLICMLDEGYYFQDQHEATSTIDIPPGCRRDFVDGDTVMTDDPLNQHGEWTLSCVGANKFGGLVGSAYGATFALARTEVHTSETPVEMTNWAAGAEWADSLGADIISSSLGYFTFSGGVGNYTYADLDGHTTVVTRAAEIAAAKGILVCNSAGNSGPAAQTLLAPADANGDSVLAIGAVQPDGVISSFSSRGPTADLRLKPDVCARGTSASIVNTSGVSAYGVNNGTSFSCPLAAGVAACLLSARPAWPATMLIRVLRETASRYSTPDNSYGYGILNGLAALRYTPAWLAAPEGPLAGFGISLLGANPLRAGDRATRVRFSLGPGPASAASVRIVDLAGRVVRTLWTGTLDGSRPLEADWDGRDAGGRRVQPGVYWVALDAHSRLASVKLVTL